MKNLFVLIGISIFLSSCNCYSTSWAHDLTHLEDISYVDQSAIDSWSCPQCLNYEVRNPKSLFSPQANIQGYGAYYTKRNAVFITFRGSVNVDNWLTNLNTVVTSYPACSGCNVHLGFYNAYKALAPYVKNVTQQLLSLYRDADLVITGHSLGGAVALLCALDFKQLYGKVDALYTFGQPRVGNQNFANFAQNTISQYFRIVNYHDTVPHVPQSILGFKHGGTQIWYSPRGMKTFKKCVSEDKSCSNSVFITSMSTQDHHLVNYMLLQVIDLSQTKHIRSQEDFIYQSYSDYQVQLAQDRKVKQIIQILKDKANL